jgi:hypothetical protein
LPEYPRLYSFGSFKVDKNDIPFFLSFFIIYSRLKVFKND